MTADMSVTVDMPVTADMSVTADILVTADIPVTLLASDTNVQSGECTRYLQMALVEHPSQGPGPRLCLAAQRFNGLFWRQYKFICLARVFNYTRV